MATQLLTENFNGFFTRINPSPTFVSQASSQQNAIRTLIEDPNGPAASLRPKTFLQGSYGQRTAIYTINDVDIVALCQELSIGGGGPGGRTWSRDEIFATIAAPLLNHWQYRDKVRYDENSMCVKVDLGIRIEILPVVLSQGVSDPDHEPFMLYRPHFSEWQVGYARRHQDLLTERNQATNNSYKPMVKVLKHLRSYWNVEAISFHLECLLYALPADPFVASPAHYIPLVLYEISKKSAAAWWGSIVRTPCGERDIFSSNEWSYNRWEAFHSACSAWTKMGFEAANNEDRGAAVDAWQKLLGPEYFPGYA